MFGSSPNPTPPDPPSSAPHKPGAQTTTETAPSSSSPSSNPETTTPQPDTTTQTKIRRKPSTASKLIASARNTFANLSSSPPAISPPPSPNSCKNSAGDSHPGPKSTFRVGVTEDKNKKCRRTMEDTHSYLYNFLAPSNTDLSSTSTNSTGSTASDTDHDNGYFAIFDGHAGTFAADWCGRKLHLVLEDTIRKYPDSPIPELLDMTFTNCDGQLEKLPVKNSGCTAVCAVLRWEDRPITRDDAKKTERQRILYTANVGDARIVLCRAGKALRLSYDHKGSDENEGKRVANAGGLILNNRVNGVLAVTRALGDSYMKELVTGHPYTTESVLQTDSDEFIILACDGLWDVCTDQEAVDLIRNTRDPQQASKMLVDHALGRFSSDNLSCMVVRLDPTGKFDYSSDGGAVTSIQGPKQEEQQDHKRKDQVPKNPETPKHPEASKHSEAHKPQVSPTQPKPKAQEGPQTQTQTPKTPEQREAPKQQELPKQEDKPPASAQVKK